MCSGVKTVSCLSSATDQEAENLRDLQHVHVSLIEGKEDDDLEPPPKKKTPLPPPFIVGEGLPVVPPKLVAKIQSGVFVDMADLLKDNIEAERRSSVTGGMVASLLAGRPPRREVPDLLSWVVCFGTYESVLIDKFPQLANGLLAYQTFIVREARKCGKGWQEYDLMFRQQQASAVDVKWNSVSSALYTVTFGGPAALS